MIDGGLSPWNTHKDSLPTLPISPADAPMKRSASSKITRSSRKNDSQRYLPKKTSLIQLPKKIQKTKPVCTSAVPVNEFVWNFQGRANSFIKTFRYPSLPDIIHKEKVLSLKNQNDQQKKPKKIILQSKRSSIYRKRILNN